MVVKEINNIAWIKYLELPVDKQFTSSNIPVEAESKIIILTTQHKIRLYSLNYTDKWSYFVHLPAGGFLRALRFTMFSAVLSRRLKENVLPIVSRLFHNEPTHFCNSQKDNKLLVGSALLRMIIQLNQYFNTAVSNQTNLLHFTRCYG